MFNDVCLSFQNNAHHLLCFSGSLRLRAQLPFQSRRVWLLPHMEKWRKGAIMCLLMQLLQTQITHTRVIKSSDLHYVSVQTLMRSCVWELKLYSCETHYKLINLCIWFHLMTWLMMFIWSITDFQFKLFLPAEFCRDEMCIIIIHIHTISSTVVE